MLDMKGTLVTGVLGCFTLCLLLPVSLGSVRITPTNSVLSEGRNFTFTCTVSGTVEGALVIFKYGAINQCSVKRDGDMFAYEPGTVCSGRDSDASVYHMTIVNASRLHNSKDWFCQIGQDISNKATLVVQFPPNMTKFTANGINETHTVALGTSVTLQCHVDANPSASITIRRGNSVLSRNRGVIEASENLTSVSCRDMAIYSCDAANSVGSTTSRLQLFVRCPPTQVDRDRGPYYAAIKGEVTLHFAVLAYPIPTFTWHGPSGKIIGVHNGTLNSGSVITDSIVIRNVKKEDFGDYLIIVENEVDIGNFTVSIMLKEGLSRGMLIGIIVGCVVLGVFVIVFICIISRKLRRKQDFDSDKGETYREMERLSSFPGDDVYTEVQKPKKKEMSNGEHTHNNTEESKPLQGPKVGRDEDGLMYIGVDVENRTESETIGTSDGDPTQYAEVEINKTAVKYQENHQADH